MQFRKLFVYDVYWVLPTPAAQNKGRVDNALFVNMLSYDDLVLNANNARGKVFSMFNIVLLSPK